MDSLYLLILCLPWLLLSHLQPTPTLQATAALTLCMQPIPPLYFPFCLHSFLHPFTSSLSIFHAHTAPYTELFTLTDTAYILLSLKIPVVIHPHFLLPVCLYSSIHPAGFYSVPFVLISFREDNSACFSFTSLCSQHELLGA